MATSTQRLMKESEIPAFVQDVIDAGGDICAVDHPGYVIGDIEGQAATQDKLERIKQKYGDRDFLRLEIVAHLRSLGRYLDPGSSSAHWSENVHPRQ